MIDPSITIHCSSPNSSAWLSIVSASAALVGAAIGAKVSLIANKRASDAAANIAREERLSRDRAEFKNNLAMKTETLFVSVGQLRIHIRDCVWEFGERFERGELLADGERRKAMLAMVGDVELVLRVEILTSPELTKSLAALANSKPAYQQYIDSLKGCYGSIDQQRMMLIYETSRTYLNLLLDLMNAILEDRYGVPPPPAMQGMP